MRDVKWPELTAVVEFMYKGEINVRQEQIAPLLRVAEMLKIRGLADVKSDLDLNSESEKSATGSNMTGTTVADAAVDATAPNTRKPRISARTEWQINNLDLSEHHALQQKHRDQASSLQVNKRIDFIESAIPKFLVARLSSIILQSKQRIGSRYSILFLFFTMCRIMYL